MSTHNMFSSRNKNIMWISPLICSYVIRALFPHYLSFDCIISIMEFFTVCQNSSVFEHNVERYGNDVKAFQTQTLMLF